MIKKMIVLLIAVTLLLAGCALPAENETPTPLVEQPTSTPTMALIEIVETPAAVVPLMVLLAEAEANQSLAVRVRAVAAELAAQAGLVFETRTSSQGLPENTRVVVVIPPVSDLDSIVAGNPSIQFVTLGMDGLAPAPNLTTIVKQGGQAAAEGFMAGYLAAVMSAENRVGMIGPNDQTGYRIGFVNGAEYFCGLCSPLYPPFEDYPLRLDIPPNPSQGEWQVAADTLLGQFVRVFYVAPGVDDPQLLEYLAANEITLVGTNPPPDSVRGQWLGTAHYDLPAELAEILPSVFAGGGQGTVTARLRMDDLHESVTVGRQAFFAEMVQYLAEGVVDPFGE